MEEKQKGLFIGQASQTPLPNQVSPYPSMVQSFSPDNQIYFNMGTQAPVSPFVMNPCFLPYNSLDLMHCSSPYTSSFGMENQTQYSKTYHEPTEYPMRSNYTFALEKKLNLPINEPIPDQFEQGQTLALFDPPFYKCSVCYLGFPTAQSLGGHMSSHTKTRKAKKEATPIGAPASKKTRYSRSMVPAKKLPSSILKTSKIKDIDGVEGQRPTNRVPAGEDFHADDEVGNKATTPVEVGEGDIPKEKGYLSDDSVTSEFSTLSKSFRSK